MPKMISAKQLRDRLQDVVETVRRGGRFTVLYRSRPAFDIVPVGSPPIERRPRKHATGIGSAVPGNARWLIRIWGRCRAA